MDDQEPRWGCVPGMNIVITHWISAFIVLPFVRLSSRLSICIRCCAVYHNRLLVEKTISCVLWYFVCLGHYCVYQYHYGFVLQLINLPENKMPQALFGGRDMMRNIC